MAAFHLALTIGLFSSTFSWNPVAGGVVGNAATIENVSTSPTSSAHFLFWETCEDQWNKEKKKTEKCCRGNYKCSNKLCEGNQLCRFAFGFMKNSMWCHVDKCEAKKDDNKDKSKDKDNGKDSGKDKGKDKDKDKDKGKDEDKDKGKDKDKNKGKNDKEKNDKDIDKRPENKDDQSSADKDKNPTSPPSPSPSASPRPSKSPIPDSTDPLHCNGVRNRREIRDMSAQQRRDWQDAILALRSDLDENGDSEWDRLVRTHIRFSDEAHGGSYFLPWHRLFLLRLENALRKINPNVALPYWDWTKDAGDAALSPIWSADHVGAARAGNSPIQTGPFANMDAKYPVRHTVQRDFNSGTSGAIPLLYSRASLDRLIYQSTWMDFVDGIEGAHALPHISIGGDMADVYRASNDPIFHVHHAFVDQLWQIRQRRGNPSEFGGTHDFGDSTRPASADQVLAAFGVTARTAIDLSCVNYISPNRGRRSISGRRTRGRPQSVCGRKSLIKKPKRCRRGHRILRREAAAAIAE